jgi:hypothetical protein
MCYDDESKGYVTSRAVMAHMELLYPSTYMYWLMKNHRKSQGSPYSKEIYQESKSEPYLCANPLGKIKL